jgi:amino acid adenylation domain-containing protein
MNEIILQNVMISSGRFDRERNYWSDRLSGELAFSSFAHDRHWTAAGAIDRNAAAFHVPDDLAGELMRIGNRSPYGVFILVLTALNIVLAKYSGNRDILIGTPVVMQETDGRYFNSFVILKNRVESGGKTTVKDLLRQVKRAAVEAYENMNYPLLRLKVSDPSIPLFDTLVQFRGIHRENAVEGEACGTVFSFSVEDGRMRYEVDYRVGIYDHASIERLGQHLENCLWQITREPGSLVSEIDFLSQEEKHRLLEEFNATDAGYPVDRSIHRLIEEEVERSGDRIAVTGSHGVSLTFRELNKKADRAAHLLRTAGIQPGTIAALVTEQTVEMFIAILAVVKAGGAYLPIDPGIPAERLNYMLKDSSARVLLNGIRESARPVGNIETVDLSRFVSDTPDRYPDQSDHPGCSGRLAYVIYTSGSTGFPKGVMVEHRSLVNLCFWHNREFHITAADRAVKYANMGFDASVWEIFPYLIAGAALYIVHEDIKLDIPELNRFFESRYITAAFLPTLVCEQFLKVENRSLRVLLTGGDKLKEYRETPYLLVNNYGPTENTVVATRFFIDRDYANIPIGSPIGNNRVFILDRDRRLQPVGVPGELCISGDSLARGYLNCPELTAERFDRSYRTYITYHTGDLARWLPDGNIEFLGRIDTQVKIRGFRIELGEIENRLLTHPGVAEAVVVAKRIGRGGSEAYLCAYIVPGHQGGQQPDPALLKEFLSGTLPDYMVPSHIVALEQMPLTSSGKVDRKKLSNLKDSRPSTRTAYVAPGSHMETLIADTWKEVLGLEEVGIHDNFFDLGGNSFDIINVNTRLQEALGREFPVVKMFKYPTVGTLAHYLTRGESGEFSREKEEQIVKKMDKGKNRLKERTRRRKGM